MNRWGAHYFFHALTTQGDLELGFVQTPWHTYNLGSLWLNHCYLAGNGTDWEYVYRVKNPQNHGYTWSGGNHGNERMLSLKFFDLISGEEIRLSKHGFHFLRGLCIQEETLLMHEMTNEPFCYLVRTYTIRADTVELDVAYVFIQDIDFFLSYTAMTPVSRDRFDTVCFLGDEDAVTEITLPPKNAIPYGDLSIYQGYAAADCLLYRCQKGAEYVLRTQVISREDSLENFSNEFRTAFVDMGAFGAKLYFSKFDELHPTHVPAGTVWKTLCKWQLTDKASLPYFD